MTLTLGEDQAGPHFLDRKHMHAWLGSRLVPQGPTQRFAIDGHLLLLLLPCLLSQTAGSVLTPLCGFPTRSTPGDHREQVLRVDFAKRIHIGSHTGHARTPQVQVWDDPALAQSDPLGGGSDLGLSRQPRQQQERQDQRQRVSASTFLPAIFDLLQGLIQRREGHTAQAVFCCFFCQQCALVHFSHPLL